jgi:hypothetical protein
MRFAYCLHVVAGTLRRTKVSHHRRSHEEATECNYLSASLVPQDCSAPWFYALR